VPLQPKQNTKSAKTDGIGRAGCWLLVAGCRLLVKPAMNGNHCFCAVMSSATPGGIVVEV
jgi:hypothetical protein